MGSPLRRAGLVVHSGRRGAVEAARTLTDWLRAREVETRSLRSEATNADEAFPPESFADGLDLVVSVGGDGTLLRAAQLANAADVPVLGVKVGRLGFLTEVEPREAPALLAGILRGSMVIEERMAVEAVPVDAPWTDAQWALNEVIVEKSARHRLITLGAAVAEEYITTFSADGVIVATPTGSTAYSFSARGPIVSPKLPCILLTPVSPHMVFDRPLVLSPEEAVLLEVLGEEPGLLSADGRPGLELPVGSRVRIEQAKRPARLVRRADSPSFLSLLREKFSLPGEAPHGTTLRHRGRGVRPASPGSTGDVVGHG
ncbi:MAG: NAD(+)/NADH kinase [Actinobacteria bacterium]|nr:NAD(+)/NADH kinase [Actinomycetota bacterium]